MSAVKWRPSARAQLAAALRELEQERLKSAVLRGRADRLAGDVRELEHERMRRASVDPERVVRLQLEQRVPIARAQLSVLDAVQVAREHVRAGLAAELAQYVHVTAYASFGGDVQVRGAVDVLRPHVLPGADAFGLPVWGP